MLLSELLLSMAMPLNINLKWKLAFKPIRWVTLWIFDLGIEIIINILNTYDLSLQSLKSKMEEDWVLRPIFFIIIEVIVT